MIIVPAVKQINLKDGLLTVPAKFYSDPQVEVDSKIFYDYVKKYRPNAQISGLAVCTVSYDETLAKEEYELTIDQNVEIKASTEIGVNHALATLVQLIDEENGTLPLCTIKDCPDFSYRTFMLDVSRMAHPIKYLYAYIDLCWLYKMSYFQIHFTDTQGDAFPSKTLPKLADPKRVFTPKEMKAVLNYANSRGVNIVPEIDMPGHSNPFMAAYPEIFGTLTVLPASEKVFDVIKRVFDDVMEMFPTSEYIHIGGDEVAIKQWEECPQTQAWMKENNIETEREVYALYLKEMIDYILSKGRTPILWEGFAKEFNHLIDRRAVVVSWENHYQNCNELTEAGFTIINASWQPMYIVYPVASWTPEYILGHWNVYNWQHFAPLSDAFHVPGGLHVDPKSNNVLGGQMCAWGDKLQDYEDIEKGAYEEYTFAARRIPALAQKVWNKDADVDIEGFCAKMDSLKSNP